jgi:hypothetical protein
MEAIITHTYAADPAIMETTHWNTPDCAIAAADAITCNSLNAETFQFFEFVAAADTFISVMSIEVTVPQIEKQPNGNIMYVEKYVVNLDAGIGSVAPIREQMKDGVPGKVLSG